MERRIAVRVVAVLALARPLFAQPFDPEFRVNTYTTGSQRQSKIAFDGSGRSVIVWWGPGTAGSGVYGQRYDAEGAPLGNEFRVSTTAPAYFPDVGSDPAGDFVVVWEAKDNGYCCGVFGQRFDSTGAPVGGEFRVNALTTGNQSTPRVTTSPAGFVVVWQSDSQYGLGPVGVYAQRYSGAGVPLGEFRVNLDAYVLTANPDVAADASGDLVFAWDRQGTPGIYARRYTAGGVPLTGEFRVDTSTVLAPRGPRVAAGSAGTFVVVWRSFDGGYLHAVSARRFAGGGAPLGDEFRLSAFTTNVGISPDVAAGGTRFLVAWSDAGANARFLDPTGSPVGDALRVNESASANYSVPGADATGRFLVSWTGGYALDDLGGVRARRLAAPPEPLAPEFRANTITTSEEVHPRIAQDGSGNFVVVWGRWVNGSADIDVEAQRYSHAGAPLGGEFRVNTYTSGNQYHPDVAVAPGGDFVVVWDDIGNPGDTGSYGVFGQRFSGTGSALGAAFRVNTTTTDKQYRPRAAADSAGNFAVVWNSYQNGSHDVYAQRYSSSGAPLGAEFLVNTTTSGNQFLPAIGGGGSGFVVVWRSADAHAVVARRFTSSGGFLGGEFQVNALTSANVFETAAAMDAQGSFVVAWEMTGSDGSGGSIVARRFDASGAPVAPEFVVNTYTTGYQVEPAVSADTPGFVVTWVGYHDGDSRGIFAQRYKKTGQPVGTEFRVNTYTTSYQDFPAVAFGRSFVIVWEGYNLGEHQFGVYGQRYESCLPGDASGDGLVDVSDVFYLINSLFAAGPAPCNGDANGDGLANVADVFYLINDLFAGGPPPI